MTFFLSKLFRFFPEGRGGGGQLRGEPRDVVWQHATDATGAAALVIHSRVNGLPRFQSSLLIVFLPLLNGSARRRFLAAPGGFGAGKRRTDSATCGKWSLGFSDRKKDTIYFQTRAHYS
jgi:hypothetical protein